MATRAYGLTFWHTRQRYTSACLIQRQAKSKQRIFILEYSLAGQGSWAALHQYLFGARETAVSGTVQLSTQEDVPITIFCKITVGSIIHTWERREVSSVWILKYLPSAYGRPG